jgi:microsomal dipeptidase-like Zn-dependent dipeptidase
MAEKPPIVSHGAAAGAAGRDLADDSIRALHAAGGVLGIHFYSSYLGENPGVDDVIRQVDYLADLVGTDVIGLGIDFFPSEGPWRDFQLAQGTRDISWAIPDIGKVELVTEALVERNYSDDDIGKILGGNFLRVCRAVFPRRGRADSDGDTSPGG